ncbi:ABC transporter substrate-binding protein [uncultured Shimia sp.]|uniref:ABC transporter substrate-binding protein n=1 Tax=uncultured Shimia sp. TaxID=573152 RepID=UPI0026288703|nr:ABC transporter substrate-binding protein [uncultured Shimia sp.]
MQRRHFLALSAATLATPAILRSGQGDLKLSVGGYRLDRTAALFDGKIAIEGASAEFQAQGIGDLNTLAFSGEGPHGLTEIGLHPFMLAHANDAAQDYALLPVFLLRQFRHKSIFVRTDAGITSPADLKGRRIGSPGYSSSSLTWIRGIMEDEYGVKPTDVDWVTAKKDSSADAAGKVSAQETMVPEGISMSEGPEGMDESEMLLAGEVDALFHAATPAAFIEGDPRISRLFTDVRAVEQDYYKRTGIFPIMHVLAIRRDLAAQEPWLARAAFDAYVKSKQAAYQLKDRLTWATDMMPWYSAELDATRALMGRNFYSYGLEGNRKTLETFFGYSYRQGLASRELTLDELFLPGSLEFEDA